MYRKAPASRKDVVVIGAGSAGLAVSRHLTLLGIDHVVLDRGTVATTWETRRWDSFRLVLPNRMFDLPGFPYDGEDPGGFMAAPEVAGRLRAYAAGFGAPVRSGVDVAFLEPASGPGYRLRTSSGEILARVIVAATGAYQRPWVPSLADEVPSEIFGIHTDHYRNPGRIPPGGVLVVGSGQSGAQIAEELRDSGRDVWLSLGSCGWLPRRYRGRDIAEWEDALGIGEETAESLPAAARLSCWPQGSGQDGGHDLNPRRLAAKGVHLLGRTLACDGVVMSFSTDLPQVLLRADIEVARLKRRIDGYIAANRIDAPEEAEPPAEPSPQLERPSPRMVDLAAEGIRSIIWATGFHPSFGWIRLPIFDERGTPRHRRGISEAHDLYFIGLPWLYKRKSSLIPGVGEDAAFIAGHIAGRLRAGARKPPADST